jgi:hypothetical protein
MASVLTNPSDAERLACGRANGTEGGGAPLRTFRNPRTGDRYYWPSDEATHNEMARRLGLEYFDEDGIWWPPR